MTRNHPLEALLERDRAVVLAGLAGVTALAWIYLFVAAAEMGGMAEAGAMAVMRIRPWTGLDFLLLYLMWVVMMVAMMLPSAAPMILLFAAIRRKWEARGVAFAPVGALIDPCGIRPPAPPGWSRLRCLGSLAAVRILLSSVGERTVPMEPIVISGLSTDR